ncbi:MAG: carbohydrate binding family 9 domain-containing protein, partial [Muricauda sp.]|nr:carbohydrate binding family 9 domain-containing protein [Allomuricauda sp.]
MSKFRFVVAALLLPLALLGQMDHKTFTVRYTEDIPKIDGILDEPVWEMAESAGTFHQYFPSDTTLAGQQTDIRMLYNNTTLYIGIKLNTEGDDYVIPSLQRDYRAGGNDNISLLFDTFNDGTNAFLFGMNPYGVRREALISNGGSGPSGFTTSWDVKWQGETKLYDGYYICEIAIPLTSFKFKQGETKWRFNSYRFDMQSNETSTWMKIPQNQLVYSLAFMGDMVFEKPLGKSRTPMALIPYVNGIVGKDYETGENLSKFDFGGDAKVSIGNGMNLDVTINPDFSNVEVDNLVVNLTRFEVSLPEKRQFFIDNSDLFGSFGSERDANPFFSRRIGIAENLDGETIQNGIIGGVRLSGKLTEDWRLGLLNIQTEADEANEIASNNNTVVALQKKMFARSNLSLLFVNRQTFEDYDFLDETDRYNRVVGLDYNLASADNIWTGKFYYHKSFAHGIGSRDGSGGIDLRYNSRYFNFGVRGSYVGDDFRSDLGYIRRQDIVAARPFVEFNFWPMRGKLNFHGFRFSPNFIWRPTLDYQNTDYTFFTSWEAKFKSQEEISARIFNRYT